MPQIGDHAIKADSYQLGKKVPKLVAEALVHDKQFLDAIAQELRFFRGQVTDTRTDSDGIWYVKIKRAGQTQKDDVWYPSYVAPYTPQLGDHVLMASMQRRTNSFVIGVLTGATQSPPVLSLNPATTAIPDPTGSPTLAATSPSPATSLLAGSYAVGYCYTTPEGGRTKLSKTTRITISAGQGIQATVPGTLPAGATGVEFYIDDCAPFGQGDSWTGGASVSGLTLYLNGGGQKAWNTNTGMFVNVPAAPSGDMTLWDWNFPSPGYYYRVKLTSALHVVLEWSLLGTTSSVDAGLTLSVGTWCWISTCNMTYNGTSGLFPSIQVWQQSGTTPGMQQGSQTAAGYNGGVGFSVGFSGTFGVGVSLSSSYLGLPNTDGWEESKAVIQSVGPSIWFGQVISPPTSDAGLEGIGNITALYLARQAGGPVSSLLDSSGSGYNAAAASQGLTILPEGPYT